MKPALVSSSEDHVTVPKRESCISPQCEVHVKRETRITATSEHEARTHISTERVSAKRDARVHNKRDVRVLNKHEGRVQTVSGCEGRVSTEHNSRVSYQHEVRVSSKKRETHVRLTSPHLQRFKASPSEVPSTDLRDYLTRKRSVHQIAPRCHCEQLISAVLSDRHCGFQMTKPSVFNRLSTTLTLAKRRRFRKKKLFSNVKYPEVNCEHGAAKFHDKQVQGKTASRQL